MPGASGGQGTAVCRYYGTQGGATDAHVFTVVAAECTSYRAVPRSASWVRENASAFEAALPYSVTGACPKNTVPVYRIDNKRADVNPRYTADLATTSDARQGPHARRLRTDGRRDVRAGHLTATAFATRDGVHALAELSGWRRVFRLAAIFMPGAHRGDALHGHGRALRGAGYHRKLA